MKEASRKGRSMHGSRLVASGVFLSVLLISAAHAEDLDQVLPGLFGGQFNVATGLGAEIVGVSPFDSGGNDAFETIGASIGSFRNQIPVASSSAGYTYEFDPDLDIFVRTADSLGPLFTERSQTLGKGKFAVAVSYTRVSFDTFYGTNLDNIRLVIPAGPQVLSQAPAGNALPGVSDDYIAVDFDDFDIDVDNIGFFFTYGVTDDLDVGIVLPLVNVSMSGTATATINDPDRNSSTPGTLNRLRFVNQGGTVPCSGGSSDTKVCDSFDQSSFGPGDLYLRAKYHLLKAKEYWVDVAGAATLTIPTGGADDFRGYNDPTGTPILIISKSTPFVSPHLNGGFALRSKEDGTQALWAAGADIRIAEWLTAVPDVLAFYDLNTNAANKNDIYQFSMGFKLNPWSQLVWAFNVQFPLNREGLRADVIYTTQFEYSF